MIKCPNCNKEIDESFKFCFACGAPVGAVASNQPSSQEASAKTPNSSTQNTAVFKDSKQPVKKPKRSVSKKLIAILSSLLSLILIVCILLFSPLNGILKSLFEKDSPTPPPSPEETVNSYALYMKEGELYYTGVSKINPIEVTEDLDGGYTQTAISKDGKTLFYLDGEDADTLYYRDISDEDSEPVKLDSDVEGFRLNEAGNRVVYRKDGTVYLHNLKDKEKLASNVYWRYAVSDDCKRIAYIERNDYEDPYYTTYDLFYIDGKKETVKIDSDIHSIVYTDEKLNTFYYIKEGALYKKVGKENKVKISSNVDSVIGIYENGTIYYIKDNESDSVNHYMLCYYDGKTEKILTNSCFYASYAKSGDIPVFIFYKQINTDMNDFTIEHEYFLVYEDTVSAIGANISGFEISEDAKTIYFVDDCDEHGVGNLYKMDIVDGKAQTPEKYDENVYRNDMSILPNGKPMYFKNITHNYESYNEKGEMYIDKNKIDVDVVKNGIYYIDNGDVVYKTNVSDSGAYTLKYLKDGKVIKIADNVYALSITPGGEILYIKDYNDEKQKGDLYIYKDGKSEKIDEDVSRIVTVYSDNWEIRW